MPGAAKRKERQALKGAVASRIRRVPSRIGSLSPLNLGHGRGKWGGGGVG